MAAPVLVIGASGEVGEGIVAALLAGGRQVIAAARSSAGLQGLAERLRHPPALQTISGSLESDAAAEDLARRAGPLSVVVVSVNASRQAMRLDAIDSPAMAAMLHADLLTHYAAARCFLPRLPHDGCLLGIGGGSADFILDGGVAMSMAQAALRQMYRGLAHERAGDAPALRELIIASVVAGRSHGGAADPLWVTPREVGDQAVAMIAAPDEFPGTVWRIGRRGPDGRPAIARDGATDARKLPL